MKTAASSQMQSFACQQLTNLREFHGLATAADVERSGGSTDCRWRSKRPQSTLQCAAYQSSRREALTAGGLLLGTALQQAQVRGSISTVLTA